MKTIAETDADYICNIQTPCFDILTKEEIDLICASKTQVQFRKGDTLTKQGTFASYALFVINGLALQYIESETSKSFNLTIIQPGEFIGLSSAFSTHTFSYSTVALTDCQAFLIEKSAVIELIKQNGTFGLGIIKRYCEQNSGMFDSFRMVLYKQMNGRMADVILYLDSFKNQYPEIFELLGRKDIANFAGITTESTVKILKSLEKDNLIKLTNKDIEIVDYPGLKDLSKHG